MRLAPLIYSSSLVAVGLFAACTNYPALTLDGEGDGDRSGMAGSFGGDDLNLGNGYGGANNNTGSEDYYSFASIRVEPGSQVLRAQVGEDVGLDFKVIGVLASGEEIDITSRAVFYVPDQWLIGGFPADGSNRFSVRLPADENDYPQRGGVLTVQAQVQNPDGTVLSGTTKLTVHLESTVVAGSGSGLGSPAIGAEPEAHFTGTAQGSYAPVLVYPNNGVLLPPNLGQLEVHFQEGNSQNSLYQVSFASEETSIDYYVRCDSDSSAFETDACVLTISGAEYEHLAASNQGLGPVTLRVRGSDESGNFGESAEFEVEFAEERVDGAVYYWSTKTPPGGQSGTIVRFDFGSGMAVPEDFIDSTDIPNNSRCVGCHALSRQGDKMFLGLSNSGDARMVFMNDVTADFDAQGDFLTYNGSEDIANNQYSLMAAFNPSGDEFVSVKRKNASESENTLFFHDGDTGVVESSISLPFVASHPDWSPVEDKIALTRISGTNSSTIEFFGGGISVIEKQGGSWDVDNPLHLVPPAADKNRYTPNFLAGGDVLLYSQVDCDSGRLCNGYSDFGASVWATGTSAGSTPVHLDKAGSMGVADSIFDVTSSQDGQGIGRSDLMDTFPKGTPFETNHNGKRLLWYTVSSRRRAGLRKKFLNSSVVGDPASHVLLWMFAIDPEKVKNGEDGSYTGFFLPFQEMDTCNHMAQWTEQIADAPPPPPEPTPPQPPVVPPPVPR